jgi:uncharacterized membrane protein
MVIGLVIFCIGLFIFSLYLSTGLAPSAEPGKKLMNSADDSLKIEEKKCIVVKLPENCLIPEDYTLDLKVSLHRCKDIEDKGKPNKNSRWYKNQYHELDEYM